MHKSSARFVVVLAEAFKGVCFCGLCESSHGAHNYRGWYDMRRIRSVVTHVGSSPTIPTMNTINPNDCFIVGLDADSDGVVADNTHELFCDRLKEPVGAAFMREVAAYGVLQAVTLTEVDGKLCVVAGRRRVRAAREAGLESIPCTTMAYGENATRFVLAENAHRRDNQFLANAATAQRYKIGFGWSNTKIADAMNVSQSAISQWLKLLQAASKAVLRAVNSNKLSASAALKLCKLSDEEQDAALTKAIEEGGKITINKASAAAGDKPKKIGKKKWLEVASVLNAMGGEGESVAAGIWLVFGDIEKEQFDNDELWEAAQKTLKG